MSKRDQKKLKHRKQNLHNVGGGIAVPDLGPTVPTFMHEIMGAVGRATPGAVIPTAGGHGGGGGHRGGHGKRS